MRLVAVYFPGPSPNGLPYRKAMVYTDDKQYFLDLGAVEEQPTKVAAPKPEPKPVPKPEPRREVTPNVAKKPAPIKPR